MREASWPIVTEKTIRWRRPSQHEAWLWPLGPARDGPRLRSLGPDGRYELLGVLSKGGQAYLWAASDHQDDGALVAVKMVRPDQSDPSTERRLVREARILEKLADSPQVMAVNDWWPRTSDIDPGHRSPWLVLPFRPHVTLGQALDEFGGTLGVRGAGGLGLDLARGLAHLHANGVVHRDLSPGNVLLTPGGAVITDFGMAWSSTFVDEEVERRSTTGLTRAFGRARTEGWLAPEAVDDAADRRPDREPASDVYCWGLHVFAALVGRHPFAGTGLYLTTNELNRMYIGRESVDAAPLRAADPLLAALVEAALADLPQDRPRAEELAAALLDERPDVVPVLGPTQGRARDPRPDVAPVGPRVRNRTAQRRRRRRRPLLMGVAALSVIVAFAAIFAVRQFRADSADDIGGAGVSLVTPAVKLMAEQYPKGNRLLVSWSAPDRRPGAVTTLVFEPAPAVEDCPQALTAAGSCEITVGWQKAVSVRPDVTYTPTGGSADVAATTRSGARTTGTTRSRPELTLEPGRSFLSDGLTYCTYDITLAGFKPSTTYDVTLYTSYDMRRNALGPTYSLRAATDAVGHLDAPDALDGLGYSPLGDDDFVQITVDDRKARVQPWDCS